MYDDSLIIFTSDHGDMLGDHYLWRKTYPYNGSTHIPMVLKWPTSIKTYIKRGGNLDHLIELRDILPTFLDVADVTIPDEMDGKSMISLVKSRNVEWRETLDLEHSLEYTEENAWVALTDGVWKYIFYRPTGGEQLFNAENDHNELKNLVFLPEFNDKIVEWRGKMVKHLIPRGEDWVKDGKLVASKKSQVFSPNFPKTSLSLSDKWLIFKYNVLKNLIYRFRRK
ncbi:MAG: sulfatase/phosphatase domain-containing protein [Promethearchaeota archaeon]